MGTRFTQERQQQAKETPVRDQDKQFWKSVSVLLDSWGVALRHRTPWRELTPRQRQAIIVRGALQVGLLAAALNDLRRRPASQIRGPKPLWAAISFVNYLGAGPIAYFLLGRRWPVAPLRAGNGVGTRDMLAL
jgi:hypothetical protein